MGYSRRFKPPKRSSAMLSRGQHKLGRVKFRGRVSFATADTKNLGKVHLSRVAGHRHVNFATITSEGVGAIHLKTRLPFYRLQRVTESLGLLLGHNGKHHHLKIYNNKGDLIATMVNLDLVLLPKYAKSKRDSIEFVNALLEHRP